MITDKIGEVAYKLQFPTDCNIHLVFHVSQLKQAVASTQSISTELPDPTIQFQVPLAILDRCLQ
jgi:hypothetical protein